MVVTATRAGPAPGAEVAIGYERLKEQCMEVEEGIVRLLQPYQHSRETWHAVNAKLSEAKEAMGALESCLLEYGRAPHALNAVDDEDSEIDGEAANRTSCHQQVGDVDLVALKVVEAKQPQVHTMPQAHPYARQRSSGYTTVHPPALLPPAAVSPPMQVDPFVDMKRQLHDGFSELIISAEEIVRDTRERTRCFGDDETDVRPAAVLSDCVERGVKDLKECRSVLAAVEGTPALQASVSRFVMPCKKFLDTLNELVGTDTLENKALFGHLDEAVRRAEFDALQLKEKVALDTSEGLVTDLEGQYKTMLTTQEGTCTQLTEKLAAVERLEADIHAMRDRVTATIHEYYDEYDGVGDEISSWSERCTADMQALCTAQSIREGEYSKALYRLKEEAEKADERLKENARRQVEAWARLAGCERDLTRLAKERYVEVQQKIVALNEARKVRARHAAFLQWGKGREAQLRATVQNCEKLADISRYLKTFIQNREQSVASYFGALQCKADILKDETHKKYLEVFRGMYIDQGDLRAKKHHALLRITDELDQERMHLTLCQESLDPRAKLHAGRVKQLSATRDEAAAGVEDIDRRSALYLEWFKPTETALMLTDRDAAHPVSALRQKEDARHQKLIAYKQLMSADAQGGAADEDAVRMMLPRPPPERHMHSPPQRGARGMSSPL